MIVIPMAGLSRRFLLAGYERPKYMLEIGGMTAFDHSLRSFEAYFAHTPFLFVARETGGVEAFIRDHAAALGIADARIVILAEETAGQAETVARGLDAAGIAGDVPITIFNIDTFRPGFRHPEPARMAMLDGYLEVFRGSGDNWSYVRPSDPVAQIAAETAEKRPISDLCCTGLYHFARADDFRAALKAETLSPQAPELYVAPLYNHLIGKGLIVGYEIVEASDVIFCGTPAEYEALLADWVGESRASNSPA
ncbi:glycosyltransferase family 2 protein [Polymorphobacter sp.]|uniref:glycosyltransferase family 2 protein n=1 Tax=Polymorphobacter sp. TaxID=1909290 RepID=UPI003F6F1EDE